MENNKNNGCFVIYCILRHEICQMQTTIEVKVCEYLRSKLFHDYYMLQDQASGERSGDQRSFGFKLPLPQK